MSVFQQLITFSINDGKCTKVFCEKSIPEKLISFHRDSIHKKTTHEYRIVSLEDCQLSDLFADLSITFLGESCMYALKDGDLSVGDRKKVDSFLKEYAGPHILYFFTSDVQYEKNALCINARITKSNFQDLLLAGDKKTVAPAFIEKLFLLRSSYTFDESLTLMHYADLLGSRNDLFFTDWFDRILIDEISLFTLSQYFFSQQRKLFLEEWLRLRDKYPVEFWIAFFSEQLWQASVYLFYVKVGKPLEGKRYGYRLPFSFIQKDWKKYSIEKITEAHQFLYNIDYSMKNGYALDGLELFIHKALVF